MGHCIDEKKHIENDTNNNKNKNEKYKTNSYEKIKDIVLNKNEKIVIEKNNIKNNKNNIKKPVIDIGL